jgi:hypothetical protein
MMKGDKDRNKMKGQGEKETRREGEGNGGRDVKNNESIGWGRSQRK